MSHHSVAVLKFAVIVAGVAGVFGVVAVITIVVWLYKHHMIMQWDAGMLMKTCPECEGAGALAFNPVGKDKIIPRKRWESASWARANLKNCRRCWGTGVVPKGQRSK